MKLIVEIGGVTAVVSTLQAQAIMEVLSRADRFTNIDVGKGNGTHGYMDQYIHGVKPMDTQLINIKAMTDEAFEATKFVAAQHEEKK